MSSPCLTEMILLKKSRWFLKQKRRLHRRKKQKVKKQKLTARE